MERTIYFMMLLFASCKTVYCASCKAIVLYKPEIDRFTTIINYNFIIDRDFYIVNLDYP